MRIAVLSGGDSPEREVSLASGRAVQAALEKLGHTVRPIDPGPDLPLRLAEEAPDFVWIALHGDKGENGSLQGLLDWMGLPYNGSGVTASALAMDKVAAKRLFVSENIPTPAYRVATAVPDLALSEAWSRDLGLPLVIKPADGGSTVGVTIARSIEGIPEAVRLALEYCRQVLIEQYIPGQEITVALLDGLVLPAIEIVPQGREFYDYEAKYAPGGSRHLIPPRLDADVLKASIDAAYRACQVVGSTGLVRADVRVDPQGRPWVLEVNTLPGMTSTSLAPEAAQAAGIDFEHLVQRIIDRSLD
ncbi:D-alanine--D-alanine ligase [Gloeobacter kilaueensis]|uniref:D-alanine--D-alanine ligase n=1 Tax=Gloeobacter kilaueensis (strain ATCC BAA-2537 / CCAP 1431/1 / ULC 316 / JS1) TaxID=1183438 RepID=U5QDH0_GLOK1|nr:D-alanine--D-alanine ligase [Gloeobacter kilaueensis]AGY56936.1 D-alanine--D-alanine ligase [Gloeobacter kilaueensis JS1]